MKKVINLIILVSCLFIANPLLMAEEDTKGANQKAYEHPSENAVFNRVSDWFATIGKSEEEKQTILAERKAQRAARRAEKEADKAQKRAQQKAEDIEEKATMDSEAPSMKIDTEAPSIKIDQEAPSY